MPCFHKYPENSWAGSLGLALPGSARRVGSRGCAVAEGVLDEDVGLPGRLVSSPDDLGPGVGMRWPPEHEKAQRGPRRRPRLHQNHYCSQHDAFPLFQTEVFKRFLDTMLC